jgi:hypothetical protein
MIHAHNSLAYTNHLHREHERLKRMLCEIDHEFARLIPYGQFAAARVELAQRMHDLRNELLRHFSEEEDGGCLEEAITCCPSLGAQGSSILKEHALFRQMLDNLVEQARDVDVSSARLQCNYQQFAEELRAHERAETRLLQMAFGESAECDDAVETRI